MRNVPRSEWQLVLVAIVLHRQVSKIVSSDEAVISFPAIRSFQRSNFIIVSRCEVKLRDNSCIPAHSLEKRMAAYTFWRPFALAGQVKFRVVARGR